jgi:hypothetical protein
MITLFSAFQLLALNLSLLQSWAITVARSSANPLAD